MHGCAVQVYKCDERADILPSTTIVLQHYSYNPDQNPSNHVVQQIVTKKSHVARESMGGR